MRKLILGFFLSVVVAAVSQAQTPGTSDFTKEEQEVLTLSKDKWQWMADKNADKLRALFHDESKFVHMSGTWKKDEELEIIKTGTIWYRKATIHDSAISVVRGK